MTKQKSGVRRTVPVHADSRECKEDKLSRAATWTKETVRGNNGQTFFPSLSLFLYFSFDRVKYCPFHSQYVICSFPYDRSMIRFKNVHRRGESGSFLFAFVSRSSKPECLCRGRKSNFIERGDLEKLCESLAGIRPRIATYGIPIAIYAISVLPL